MMQFTSVSKVLTRDGGWGMEGGSYGGAGSFLCLGEMSLRTNYI